MSEVRTELSEEHKHALYIKKIEDEILVRRKKHEDFRIRNHEEILSLVDQYPLEVLRTLNESQVKALAIKFSELLRASLLAYHHTPEFEQEAKLVKNRIAKAYFSLAPVFRRTFNYYTIDLYHRKLPIPNQGSATVPLLLMPLYPSDG